MDQIKCYEWYLKNRQFNEKTLDGERVLHFLWALQICNPNFEKTRTIFQNGLCFCFLNRIIYFERKNYSKDSFKYIFWSPPPPPFLIIPALQHLNRCRKKKHRHYIFSN